MIAYFDASALAKAYVEEEHSDAIRKLLHDTTPATSRLTEVEIASALARRHREGALDHESRHEILQRLTDDFDSLYVIELVPEVVASARALLTRRSLRAADSVQLGSALVLRQRMGTPVLFVEFDDRLRAAAAKEDLALFEAESSS